MTNHNTPGHECLLCGEFIAADSALPDACPECGGTTWVRISPYSDD